MGLALRLLGRLLFVVLFVGAGIQKVQKPADSVAQLTTSYQTYHSWITNTEVYKNAVSAIPPNLQEYVNLVKEYTQPKFVQDHATLIITYVGYFEIAASVLVFIGAPLVGFLLYVFTVSCIVIIHNPLVNPLKFHQELGSVLLSLAIAGISLFIASDVRPVCAQANIQKKTAPSKGQTEEKKKATQAATPQVAKVPERKKKN